MPVLEQKPEIGLGPMYPQIMFLLFFLASFLVSGMIIRRQLHRLAKWIDVGAEVKLALETKKAVVALESTIITHGMPYPANKETAVAVENIIRDQNAVPATIAVVKGRLKIGLSPEDINFLASPDSQNIIKTSRRDLPYVLSKGLSGGTTVSGTMVAASSVGIKVFVTGGVGGVHRSGESTMDISADLTELGRTRVAVVCSGIKSILDIPRSLEYLETQGVCVATFGPSRDFPAFYCQKSGHLAPYNVTTSDEAAALIKTLEDLEMENGVIFAVPIPQQYQLIDERTMESAIQEALNVASDKGITGKLVTPFILQHIAELTHGRSLQANIALIKNNASVGAEIAVALAKTFGYSDESKRKKQLLQDKELEGKVFATPKPEPLKPVVIGGSNLDSVVSFQEPFKVEARTFAGRFRQTGGGVGRNLADALGRLGASPTLVSAVGEDQNGKFLLAHTLNHLEQEGILVSPYLPTACYTAILDQNGEYKVGVGDMEIHSLLTPDVIFRHLHNASTVIMDANIPLTSMISVMEFCYKNGIPVIFEPTDSTLATKPFQNDLWKGLHLISPNVKELRSIASFIGLEVDANDESVTSLEEVVSMATPLAEHIHTVLVTLGDQGVMTVGRTEPAACITARYYPPTPLDHVLSVSGAGDCLAAGVVSGLLAGLEEPHCVSIGLAAACDSLRSYSTVPQQFTAPSSTPAHFTLVQSSLRRTLL